MNPPISTSKSVTSGMHVVVYILVVESCLLAIASLQSQASLAPPFMALVLISSLLVYMLMRDIRLGDSWKFGPFSTGGRSLLAAWAAHCGILLLIAFLARRSSYFERPMILTWFLITPVALFLVHGLCVTTLPRLFPTFQRRRSAVIVFANYTARRLAQKLHETASWDLRGFFDDRDLDRIGGEVPGTPLLGKASAVADYARTQGVDVVFVVLPGDGGRRAVNVLDALGDTTASVYFVPDFEVFDRLEARLRQVEGIAVLEIAETPFYGVDGLLKRLFDIGFSTLAVVGLIPVLLAIAVAVKLDSRGPVFFRQVRYGLNGAPFHVYKFRSMSVADRSKEIEQVTRDDPRVTRVGRFLRRTSLDELPQFINVLRGEMSVVGPRPHSVAHNEYYRKEVKRYMSRHKVRPGVTGWAQVNGLRGETAQLERMEERIQFDLQYIRSWSLKLDLIVIWRTVMMVFRDDQAY